jgi:hypothetical protein
MKPVSNSEDGIVIPGIGSLRTGSEPENTRIFAVGMHQESGICEWMENPQIVRRLVSGLVERRWPHYLGYAPIHAGDAGSYRDTAWVKGHA